MQKDTGLNLREIHGSENSFLAAVEEIERVALIERPFHVPIRLRFITPCPDSKTGYDYVITDASTHRTGSIYVAVSYTWLHEQSLDGLAIPDYRIRDLSTNETVPRRPRCPPIVFHRAIQYARTRGYTNVWIDQECIHQDDPTDVERYLQVMHRIYSNSKVTIAVLATSSGRIDLHTIGHFKSLLESTSCEPTDQSIQHIAFRKWFCDVSDDRWFSRTWAFQEKLSAEHVELLLPITAQLSAESTVYEDLCIDIVRMWTIAGWSSITCAVSVEKQMEMTNHMNNSRSRPAPRRLILESIVDIYEQMEQCENSVLADRLAILANICDLAYRLASTKLDHPQYSYSTCLVVLIFSNVWPDWEKRQMRYKELSSDLMDAPVGILLSYLARRMSVDGPDSKLCTERYAYESYIEKYHEHRLDVDRVRDSYKPRSRAASRRVSLESFGGRSHYESDQKADSHDKRRYEIQKAHTLQRDRRGSGSSRTLWMHNMMNDWQQIRRNRAEARLSIDSAATGNAVRGSKCFAAFDSRPLLIRSASDHTFISRPISMSEITLPDTHLRVGRTKDLVMKHIRSIFKRK
ncbi:unnamed protein product [Alternaria alternata]|jgi:hypothetical protein|nr:hypothetical protein AA0121_g6740 [Alternaria tenuissima]